MDLGLKDKVVLCMASAAGLGKGIATEMAREGAKVMICTAEPFKDQLLEAQAEIEKETGNRPETFLCDVNKPPETRVGARRPVWPRDPAAPGKPGRLLPGQQTDHPG